MKLNILIPKCVIACVQKLLCNWVIIFLAIIVLAKIRIIQARLHLAINILIFYKTFYDA